MKKQIDVFELKKIQLDILDVVSSFCKEHKILYSLGCGSMLGAARHQGFIPWDDDIDIYLLREEYDKLISLFPQEKNNVRIASLSRDCKWGRAYSKAYDARTIVKDAGNKYMIGVGIDVYPIDKVPEDNDEWAAYNKKRRFLQRIYEYKNSMLLRRGRELWKYLFLPFVKMLLLPVSERQLGKIVDRFAQRYSESDSAMVFECCQGMLQKKPFRADLLRNVREMPFEDRFFLGMIDYDEYLTNAYGDWRKLPPKEKQVSHHILNARWK